MNPHPKAKWLKDVKVGDVLKAGSGATRIVRDVGDKYVVFTIKHCSWTGRCYTVLFTNDLIQRGFKPLGKSKKLTSEIDLKIARAIGAKRVLLTCCDVEGIP